MATRPAVRPSPTAPASPLTMEAFAELCLNTVLARERDTIQRRENGKVQKLAAEAAGRWRGVKNAPRVS
jgi:hypothetical protein